MTHKTRELYRQLETEFHIGERPSFVQRHREVLAMGFAFALVVANLLFLLWLTYVTFLGGFK